MTSILKNLFGKTEPESPLDEKKKENENGGNKKLDWKQFTVKFFTHFLFTICLGTIVLGACGLYTTKVAYSGILPEDIKMAPYTEADYKMGIGGEDDMAKSFVVMNVLKERLWKGFNFFKGPTNITAQQATFIKEKFDDNSFFNWLNCIQYHKQDEFGSRWSYYMRKIFLECIASSFYIISKMFSFLYTLPEWIVLLAYFTILPFICCTVFIWSGLKGFWNIIVNLTIANRVYKNTEDDISGIEENSDFKWWRKMENKDEDFLNEYSWYSYPFIWIIWKLSFILLPIVYVCSALYFLIPMTFIATLIGLINPLLRKYKLKGDSPEKDHGLGDFIRDTFFYKKTFIIFLAAYNLLMSTGLYLNSSYTASCFIGILILALYFEMFQTKIPEDPTQLDGFETIGKYFNFIKNENGKFKCPDKEVSIAKNDTTVKKEVEITNSNASGPKVNKAPYIQKPFSTSHYINNNYGERINDINKESLIPETTQSGENSESIMNPMHKDNTLLGSASTQSGGTKTKVRTKTGKIRQKYNVSLI